MNLHRKLNSRTLLTWKQAFLICVGAIFWWPYINVSATELSTAQIYQAASPATVLVIALTKDSGGTGTGSIIDSTGHVLTNNHVIFNEEAKSPHQIILVVLKPEKVVGAMDNKKNLSNQYKAKIVASSEAYDLALLKIVDPPSSLSVLALGDPDHITIGSRVVAIGHPERGGLWSLTTGVISAEWQDYGGMPGWDIFQTETSLNRGNSGGPLIDMLGNQIGINSFIQRKSKDGLAITSINFAIKSNVAKDWLSRQGVQLTYAGQTDHPGTPPITNPKNQEPPPPPDAQSHKVTKSQPDQILVNQPEAQPESGPGLPPLRPFSLDRLVKGFERVEEDLESQMEDMEAEIRKRRR